MLEILKQGGATIIPLLFCSVVSLAVALERLIYLKKAKGNNFKLLETVRLKLSKGKMGEVKKIAMNAKGPIAGMLEEGIKYYGQGKEELRSNLELIGQNEIKKLEKRLGVLDLIATISPLLGLLGTVLGIIDSFNILAGAQGMATPAALSSGISEALISTAVGLVVAIPTMLVYTYLLGLVQDRIEDINYWFVDLVEALSQGDNNVQI
ncbi:outer membrane transport energization protein ExbB [Orenia metallireducens]|jgi:biopolymer transport protein ExbB|uniref:Outer membrane transport energization protein ExbB n=1 Tax=Orenia metallireducens TaxID=1413210 RepID=A0A285GPD3_9FIRM|nr:MotA/TolQ/ExbB proton channel family protein [Orenia metallireducens]PRX29886.1 outer membrane transport energization protein ExbB [Orenia metallireducens]SNY25490.1 outer membrane transport energization protein ExbB [Orenia metallireducens]